MFLHFGIRFISYATHLPAIMKNIHQSVKHATYKEYHISSINQQIVCCVPGVKRSTGVNLNVEF